MERTGRGSVLGMDISGRDWIGKGSQNTTIMKVGTASSTPRVAQARTTSTSTAEPTEYHIEDMKVSNDSTSPVESS